MASRIPISLLPERFRGGAASASQDNPPGPPSWVNRQITGLLQSLSRISCLHPIQTVVVVALLASTSYVGPLKESLSGEGGLLASSSSSSGGGPAVAADDWASLAEGSRTVFAGPESGWKWQPIEADYSAAAKTATTTASAAAAAARDDVDHLSLLTLVFPDPDPSSDASSDSNSAAPSRNMPLATNLTATAQPLPATSFSQDRTLAYSIPHPDAVAFLTAVREFSDRTESDAKNKASEEEKEAPVERRMWIMRAAARPGSPRTAVAQWFRSGWTGFLGLLRRAEVIDILIMALGYVAMHLTFASLFVSMRRMGSNFWLAASVLFSSTFAFLFGLVVTTQLGVPVSVVLLSEGLPFLVVTVGFEKNIVLTRAVLSHAVEHPGRSGGTGGGGGTGSGGGRGSRGASPIQNAVRAAIREKGYQIVRDYAIEIAVLILGAASGVQGGLQQFCFLAAWILVFDGILLFTFFTAILSIKLEINRMRRHVDLRRALEDDGVSGRLAEKVARSGDRSSPLGSGSTAATSILFGGGGVPKFKVLMVSGFVLVNAVNLCIIPFRGGNYYSSFTSLARGLGGGLIFSSPPAVDPFQVASAGLDVILAAARASSRPTLVTVLAPIRYQLEYPSVHYGYSMGSGLPGGPWAGHYGSSGWSASSSAHPPSASPMGGYYAMGGRMVGSLFDSLEDPILSKWIIVALAMSVALNGYLFNAARWGIKDPNLPDHEIDRADLASAERFNDAGVPTPALNGGFGGAAATAAAAAAAGSVNPPPTPSPTDDEGERGPAAAAAPGVAKPQRPANLAMTMTKLKTAATGSAVAAGSAGAAPGAASEPNRADDVLKLMIREKRVREMTDEEVIAMSLCGEIQGYALEKNLGDFTRAVRLRRAIISRTRATAGLTNSLDQSGLPYKDYNWERVFGACCENVIGYMPMPVGVAGPIVIDGQSYFVPMATTEGVLVASTSRGSKAINAGGGAVTVLTHDGMTRGPVVGFECLERAGAAKHWLDSDAGRAMMTRAFDSTSNYARLREMKATLAGTYLFIRFKTTTGDAMGMNMISKGVEHALNVMMSDGGFEDMNIISISGNYCADKKPAALNWIDGRGKGVVAEAIIPADAIRRVLKTDVDTLVDLNTAKNYIGSAMAGAIGGFNAHAANMVAAIFIATGQDPAQVVESCNCITIMKNVRGSLQISVTMPSLEVGTLGGGTILEPQAAMLEMLGVRGPHPTSPGENARRLARIIAAVTMAGELSLCGAQAAGHLVRAHMTHNRSAPPTRVATPSAGSVVGNGVATPVGLTMTSTLGRGK